MSNYSYIGIILLLLLSIPGRAQLNDTVVADTAALILASDTPEVKMDSIWIPGRSIIILGDSSLFIERDTLLIWPDSMVNKLERDQQGRSEEFYRNLKKRFSKNRFSRELYKLIFTEPEEVNKKPKARPPNTQKYHKYEGKTISKVRIKELEVLGTDINDTTVYVDMWAINLANRLHISTRPWIIRNNLFFRTGDKVDPDLLYDSERILRTLPYIKDARIYVRPSATDTGAVEVMVIVKDVWSITGGVDFVNIENFSVNVSDRNFLGWGHEFRNEINYTQGWSPEIGYEGTYTLSNISRSFISAELSYAHTAVLGRAGIRLWRSFITPEIEYAGGLEMARERRLLAEDILDSNTYLFSEYHLQDFWLGRSFQLKSSGDDRSNIQMAARTSRLRYIDRPPVTEDTNRLFFGYNLYLFSLGYAQRAYERSSLITGYGRTEDIPLGLLFEGTAGREYNEFYQRNYAAVRLSLGRYFDEWGYFRPGIAIGGFMRGKQVEQGILRTEWFYFSNLYRYRKLNIRQFLNINYTIGLGRFDEEYINLNRVNGVRGFNYNLLRGTERLTLSYEAVVFTPAYFLGFRLATFAFADLGVVNSTNKNIWRNNLYQGYGVGFRLRNENLVFKTLQIRFAWYPVTPEGVSSFGFDLSDQDNINLPDFRVERPEVLRFR